jgi:hypothetical protein
MMEELIHHCRDTTMSDPGKSALFTAALNAVLPICNSNNRKATQEIKGLGCLTDL